VVPAFFISFEACHSNCTGLQVKHNLKSTKTLSKAALGCFQEKLEILFRQRRGRIMKKTLTVLVTAEILDL